MNKKLKLIYHPLSNNKREKDRFSMTLTTAKILQNWCLVTYDIEDNAMRDRVRNKIVEMGGLQRTQSCYLIPITIRSKDEIQSWGEQTGISLVVYGLDLDVLEATNLTKQYTTLLHQQLDEANEQTMEAWKRITEMEESIDKNIKLTGVYKIIESVEKSYDRIRELINRYGNEHNEFEVEKLYSFVRQLRGKFEKLRDAKIKRVDQGIGI